MNIKILNNLNLDRTLTINTCSLFILNALNFSTSIYLETYFFFIFFGLMILIAHFCFKFYENPLNKKIRNF